MTQKQLKSLVAYALGVAARAILSRYKPKIVMITGSVGKTSTKDAVAAALRAGYNVRKSEKSMNSDFGVPFTVFGVANPWENPVAWIKVVIRACALMFLPNHYPNLLVLEVGADHPGDLAKILKIARPDALVVTRLPEVPVHVEFYDSPEAVREEEFSPAFALAPGAPLIVSADDPYALQMASRVPARLVTYGFSESAFARIASLALIEEGGQPQGLHATIACGEEKMEFDLRGSIGKAQALPLAAAVAAAGVLDVPLADAASALGTHETPPGRGRLFAGASGSVIIDDSYNASPAAVEEALETLANYPIAKGSRRIAVLGDMLELGRYSVMEHERVGATIPDRADLLLTVGIRAKGLAAAARAAGMPEGRILSFDDALSAADALLPVVAEGDVILVKGSQSIRTERLVEKLLANPADRAHLVRQEEAWKRR